MDYRFVLFGVSGLVGVAMASWGLLRFVLLRSAHSRHLVPGAPALPQSLVVGLVLAVASLGVTWIGGMWP
ncbi:hypothetical protein SZN_33751 [Streptomyces zinciresistens K42]|uniref:Uncharacterized protein n=1 Tax=Streptomyces zinciresistens K42 TaxID=700597 RepID=G2GMJ8_9ACTN|nr:hypothetical protein SZN_33751 [Streptomyces zinciresistens K42]